MWPIKSCEQMYKVYILFRTNTILSHKNSPRMAHGVTLASKLRWSYFRRVQETQKSRSNVFVTNSTALVQHEIISKTDPSEIERTYNIRKQQTQFYCVCSWELMESATFLTPPSTGLSGILLFIRTHYSWRTRILKNINIISMGGEKFYQLHTETTTAVGTSK